MTIEEKLPQLTMYADLSALPELILPENIKITTFVPGYEAHWNKIITDSFESEYDFTSHMRSDPAYRPENVLFAETDGEPAATAAAWYRDRYGPATGYIHMVGALKSRRGKGLGYYVTLAALYRLRELGYTRAALTTDDFRLPAIKTYLKLGFETDQTAHESIPERWERIQLRINN